MCHVSSKRHWTSSWDQNAYQKTEQTGTKTTYGGLFSSQGYARTIRAVTGVVWRGRPTIILWRYIRGRAPDPVETVTKSEFVPAAGAALKVALGGWTKA